jgi:TRAP-type mannitol/chloroaromatic compound transport system substrate-binding protein
MSRTSRRDLLTGGIVAGASVLAAPAVVRAQTVKWRMITSWPKNLPGPGVTAQKLADRIGEISGGALEVELHAAGEIVSGLEVLDAVSGGVAHLGHTASFFWTGKMPAAAYFTAVPFGLTPLEHIAWIEHGGGQALWDELYSGFGVKPFMAGNSGMQMGAWLKEEVHSLNDLNGLKFRIPGLGGQMMERLGVVPVLLAPSDILQSLQTGVIDGTEFLGPWSDRAAGFYKVAPYYYWPGLHEPNGTGECIVNLDTWNALSDELKVVVATACQAENIVALSETEWQNAEALGDLTDNRGVHLRQWPADIVAAARDAALDVVAQFDAGSDIERRIYASYEEMGSRSKTWSRVSAQAFLAARNG